MSPNCDMSNPNRKTHFKVIYMYSVPDKLKCHVIVSLEVQCYWSVLRNVRSCPGCMQFVQNV